MNLPLPKAGTKPGRAAHLATREADGSGEAVSALGQVMFNLGTNVVHERLDLELKRAQVDLTREMNDLRLEVDQIGDPDQSEAVWSAGMMRLRGQYLGEDGQGGGRLDPRNFKKFNLHYDQLANRMEYQLGQRHIAMRNSQREATWTQYAHEASRAAASGDAATADTLINQGDEQIDALLARNIIDANEAQRRKLALRGDISNARAIKKIEASPDEFLKEAAAGGYAGLEADTLERYKVQAQSRLDAAAKADARKDEIEKRARTKAIGDRLSEMREIFDADRPAVDEGWLADPEVQAHADYRQTLAALSLRNERHDWASMSPKQLDALIAAEKTRKVAHDYQTERLKLLEEFRDSHVDGYRSDPIRYRQKVAGDVVPLPEFDPEDPSAFVAALRMRRDQSEELRSGGYTAEARILSNEEREQLKARAAATNDPAERVALSAALAGGLDAATSDHLSGIVDDPVFSHMGALVTAGGSPAVAEEVFAVSKSLQKVMSRYHPKRNVGALPMRLCKPSLLMSPAGKKCSPRLCQLRMHYMQRGSAGAIQTKTSTKTFIDRLCMRSWAALGGLMAAARQRVAFKMCAEWLQFCLQE